MQERLRDIINFLRDPALLLLLVLYLGYAIERRLKSIERRLDMNNQVSQKNVILDRIQESESVLQDNDS